MPILEKFNYICNNIANILTTGKTYKDLVTCFLLLLYLFIATPVQLWHHHGTKYAQSHHQTGEDLLSPGQGTDDGSECKICGHSYSVYASDGLVSAGIHIYYDTLLRPGLVFGPIEPLQQLFANKSPPSKLPDCLV